MVGYNFGSPAQDGTYDLQWVTDVMGGKAPTTTSLQAGKEVTIQAKLGRSTDGSRVLPCSIKFPRQWFTLLDCKVNSEGEIVYTLSTQSGKKTPNGKLVRLLLEYASAEEFTHGDSKGIWYKLT